MFFLFKIFKKLENLFFEEPKDYLLQTRFGKILKKIPGLKNFYRAEHNFSNWLYCKLKPKGVTLINVQGNKMYINTDERGDLVSTLLIDGVWEKYETELFKKMVKEGMVVVDIGAHIGYYTLIATRLVGKTGIVYAFEPEPSNYELLCKNIEANGYTNVVPIRKAVSNKNGKTKLWLCEIDSINHSLIQDNVFRKSDFTEVELITLDDFFENTIRNNKVDLIKMDTGGTEGVIMEGAEKVLKNNNVKVLLEFWPFGLKNARTDPLELLHNLQKFGFKLKHAREISNQRNKPLKSSVDIKEFCKELKENQIFNLLLEK